MALHTALAYIKERFKLQSKYSAPEMKGFISYMIGSQESWGERQMLASKVLKEGNCLLSFTLKNMRTIFWG